MKRFSLLAVCMLLIAGGFFLGCENQIGAPEAMTLQTRSAVEVLPANVQFVGMMNMEAMQRNTAFNPIQEFDAGQTFGARIHDFIEATGFDPQKDLREVYVAASDMGPHAQPSFVAYAKFDRDRLLDYMEQNLNGTLDRTDYKGVIIYHAQENEHTLAFAVATDNMMVGATDIAAVEAMLDRLNGDGQALKDDAETMALIASASTGNSAWFVMRDVAGKVGAAPNHGDDPMERSALEIGRAIKDVAVAVTMEKDGAEGTVFLHTKEGVAASDVADLTKGVVAAMKSSSKAGDAQLQMLDRIRVRTQGDQVQVNFFVDNAMLASSR